MARHTVSDEKWDIIGFMLAKNCPETRGRKRKCDRLMFNGILWILKTGVPWRDIHPDFGPWNTVYKRFLQWAKLEVWDDIFAILSTNADTESLIIDASFVKVHQHGTGAKGGTLNKKLGVAKVDSPQRFTLL